MAGSHRRGIKPEWFSGRPKRFRSDQIIWCSCCEHSNLHTSFIPVLLVIELIMITSWQPTRLAGSIARKMNHASITRAIWVPEYKKVSAQKHILSVIAQPAAIYRCDAPVRFCLIPWCRDFLFDWRVGGNCTETVLISAINSWQPKELPPQAPDRSS